MNFTVNGPQVDSASPCRFLSAATRTAVVKRGGRLRVPAFATIAVLLFAPPTLARNPQNKGGDQKEMVGVSLRPAVVRLLERVEAAYGRPVKAIEDPSQRQDNPGRGTVERDGTPVIRINPVTGKNEEVIAHELMHLLGWARGIPWLHFVADDVESPTVRSQLEALWDLTFHAYFYPYLRELGMDPGAQELSALRSYIDRGSLPVAPGPYTEVSLALYYFKCVLLLKDKQLARRLENILLSKGEQRALDKGRRLVAAFQRYHFETPSQMLDAFVEGAGILFKSEVRVSLCCIKLRKRGQANLRTAIVFVEPA